MGNKFTGNLGAIFVNGNKIAGLKEFDLDVEMGELDASDLDADWDEFVGLSKGATGSIVPRYDPGDTLGQEALTEGAVVEMKFYPFGNTSGKRYFRGQTVLILGWGLSLKRNELLDRPIRIRINGPTGLEPLFV